MLEEKYIIKDYLEFLDENEFKNTEENIELYITGLYYDIVDDMNLFESEYKELQEMVNIADKTNFIENIIRNVLKENLLKENLLKENLLKENLLKGSVYNG